MDRETFVQVIGPVFEHSSWVADQTWPERPFLDRAHLHQALCQTVAASTSEMQLALIRAHPDLVGKAALEGTLTNASSCEQASAGLSTLTPDEVAVFQRCNRQYREKFAFPFVVCARLNKKAAILAGFEARLKNSPVQEIQTALAEVFRIAELRLNDLIA